MTRTQKYHQEKDPRQTLYGHVQPRSRLKSRSSFLTTESLDPEEAPTYRLDQWLAWDPTTENAAVQEQIEELTKGTDLPRREWVTLNRARSKVGRTAKNLHRWNISESEECSCGEPIQSMEHLLRDCNMGPSCTDNDLLDCNESAKAWIQYYSDMI